MLNNYMSVIYESHISELNIVIVKIFDFIFIYICNSKKQLYICFSNYVKSIIIHNFHLKYNL
jgi:hypothetical protein